MSEDSLTHLPDYFNRIAVLKDLKYIDEGDNNTVCMKGRVACEMGSHELMITELVFHNLGWWDLTLLCLSALCIFIKQTHKSIIIPKILMATLGTIISISLCKLT